MVRSGINWDSLIPQDMHAQIILIISGPQYNYTKRLDPLRLWLCKIFWVIGVELNSGFNLLKIKAAQHKFSPNKLQILPAIKWLILRLGPNSIDVKFGDTLYI